MAVTFAIANKAVSAIHLSPACVGSPRCVETILKSTVGIQLPKRSNGNLCGTRYSKKSSRIPRSAAEFDDPAGPEALGKSGKENSRIAASPKDDVAPTAVTWQPVSRSVNDGYQGWSSPIELDNTRTDISFNAG